MVDEPMVKISVRVSPNVQARVWLLRFDGNPLECEPARTESEVLREALAIGLKKMRKKRRR